MFRIVCVLLVFAVHFLTCLYCFYYRTRVQSLGMLVSNSLTHSLTHSCLVNLMHVTLACEDANSKLVEFDTVVESLSKASQKSLKSRSKAFQNIDQSLKPCAQSLNKNFMTKLHLPNLHQTVVNTILIINITNSNNLNKF